jgi:sigma-E factor negative regulatory protein RseC
VTKEENKIAYQGEVVEVENERIKVRIVQKSACAECHAKTACNLYDVKEKIVEMTDFYQSIKVGDTVRIEGSFTMGLKAVVYAFVIPLVLIFSVSFLILSFFQSEFLIGLSVMITLVVYYFVLYLLKEQLRSKFKFRLSKNL